MKAIQRLLSSRKSKSRRNARRRNTRRTLRLEALQSRELMAADAGFAFEVVDGNLVIEGTELDDQVYVEQLDNNQIRVTGVNENGSVTQEFDGNTFEEIVFNGGEGEDRLYVVESQDTEETPSNTPADEEDGGTTEVDPEAVDQSLLEILDEWSKGEDDLEPIFPPVDIEPDFPSDDDFIFDLDDDIDDIILDGGPTGDSGVTEGGEAETGGTSSGGSVIDGGDLTADPADDFGSGYIFVGQGSDLDLERWQGLAEKALRERGYTHIVVIDANESLGTFQESFINAVLDPNISAIVYLGHGDEGTLKYESGSRGDTIDLGELNREIRNRELDGVEDKNIVWLLGCETNHPQRVFEIVGTGDNRSIVGVDKSWNDVIGATDYHGNDEVVLEFQITSDLIQLSNLDPVEEAGSGWALGPVTHYIEVFNPFK